MVKNLWNPGEAAQYTTDLEQRVYTSRLLGKDPSLVLHGGGNTSVKVKETNLFGEKEDILYVKGSGWDLATIEAKGFAPVRIPHLLKLAQLEQLSDPQMVNELKTQMTRANAPSPSVEAILHAILPYKYVDHTHADAIVAVTNTANGRERIEEIYGDRLIVIPYVMPGFDLARVCARQFALEAGEHTLGMVLMNHGIFSFGATAQESYERMIELVSQAESYLQKQGAITSIPEQPLPEPAPLSQTLAQLRHTLSKTAQFPIILSTHRNPKTLNFAQRDDIGHICQRGPATPDHVIRTKRLPLVGQDIQSYVEAYQAYFRTHATPDLTILDPIPRVILDPELGMCTVGKTVKQAHIIADIYDHTIDIISTSTQLGGYQALSAKDIFAVEYWDLEQVKLRKGGKSPLFTGEIALVTGAASGIGKACVDSLLKRGAAVIGLDIDTNIEALYNRADFHGITCDVTDETALTAALEQAVQQFGGLDMLILNAGIFPGGCPIADLDTSAWRKVMSVNLDANLALLRQAYPLLKLAPQGGRVVVIGSKNVPAPGPGAAAYSASKAALNQLMRVAALEWGKDKIRLNTLHPNAVFDTGLWTEDVLNARAAHYGLTVEEYKTNNVLKVEVDSHSVAELAAEMCGPLFAKTTAAQVPVDGGNDRVI
ncbi:MULTISPECIES: bifunctional aldolase/short-chain dehydrogenase [unclassified Roseofilum]|uniref:bifunctional aldolase/short-chain dehydrogenase n=1 Tax=unclassified Roseofilum TaxID=2620099 RepID=UPI000E884A5B|nr:MULTISPECIES: bifunctional aldolase/short-chain dehydrogenase [unclassified Roseofilum]MBP0010924.1 bifunctional aldolase/short-chain dehydrogenase [Roseofilum sp. Belize Diploria]MBP0035322.1 bifunctional aldolase/short-chain dehydrogenase [Roseofilum sp. Belize BBD 4]HBQ98382.1 bifunctional aldolase/short-chain dehydrogenase [Cyanobacteria bacterium UBA11691]